MSDCPACSGKVPEESRFCPHCGLSQSVFDSETQVAGAEALSPSAISSDSIEGGRFAPGTLFAGRYRIVGMLGRGGMGEVYRAEDLKLRDAVAIKFIPDRLASDAIWLTRFHNEVRLAHQVTHPNVCRVHDLGESEGRHYLTMEFIDGEDLSSLLRRIGRLPSDKGIEIARQICAGLSAAHEQGVLHRDLKPANIMLDGKGRVKITDFGLATIAGEATAEVAGTPAYMAPEQLKGREVSVRSDLYSLGLVLYEIFTGKRAHRADTIEELSRLHEDPQAAAPGQLVREIDPAVERVILRCLEKAPERRPASGLEVLASLPGGDPLAMALAAGETPSPEMVAAAGSGGALRKKTAMLLLGGVFLLLILGGLLANGNRLLAFTDSPLPPQVLAYQARELVRKLGFAPPAYESSGFTYFGSILRYLERESGSGYWWVDLRRARPAPVLVWYRAAQGPMLPVNSSRVEYWDPRLEQTGMVRVLLDSAGRLVRFDAVPPETTSNEEKGWADGSSGASEQAVEQIWSRLFEQAGLSFENFERVEPARNPMHNSDLRLAWKGRYPDRDEPEIRVEAASFGGRVTYFHIVGPWTGQERSPIGRPSGVAWVVNLATVLVNLCILAGGAFLARRNLARGRGDRRGAMRLALFFVAALVVSWMLLADHVSQAGWEFFLFRRDFEGVLYQAVVIWLVYVAAEPYIRRFWPDTLISWTRLMAGRWKDPLVGRDLLLGTFVGLAGACFFQLLPITAGRLGLEVPAPEVGRLECLMGLPELAGTTLERIPVAVEAAATILLILLLFRLLFKQRMVAFAFTVLLFAVAGAPLSTNLLYLNLLFNLLGVALFVWLGTSVGLLGATVGLFTAMILLDSPFPVDFSAWYGPQALVNLLIPAALAGYGFLLATLDGERPVMSKS